MTPPRSAALAMASALALAVATPGQTPQLLIDVNPLPGVSSGPTTWGRGPVDGTLTLILDDGVNGTELWVTDGTAVGTVRVTNFSGPGPIFRWFVTMADLTVFIVERGSSLELWRTDGTAAGTFLLHAATVSSGLQYPVSGVAHGPVLFFADNGVTWRTDGTVAGTFSLGVPAAQWEGVLFGLTRLRGNQGQLIVSDGFTAVVLGSVSGSLLTPPDYGVYQVTLQFTLPSPGLLVTALHLPGTPSLLVPFGPGLNPYPGLIPVAGGALMIAESTGLSRWDGLAPPQSLRTWSSFGSMVEWGAEWVFTANLPNLGNELVKSDGTLAGTRTMDLVPGSGGSNPVLVGLVGDMLLMWANTGGFGSEPHVTDGTVAGTVRLGDLEPGPAGSQIGGWTPAGDRRAVLAVQTAALGKEPWITDGTIAGTQLLADIAPGPASSLITVAGLVSNVGRLVRGTMVFFADDGVRGREPWILPLPGLHTDVQRYSTRRFDVGDPVLGTNVSLRSTDLQAQNLGLVVVGTPLGACVPIAPRRCLHFDPASAVGVAVVFASASGDWNGSFALPNQPSLIGLDLVAQALFVDPVASFGIDVGDAHWLSLGF